MRYLALLASLISLAICAASYYDTHQRLICARAIHADIAHVPESCYEVGK